MDTKVKQNMLVTIVGVTLFAALMNLSAVLRFAGNIISLILPIIVGGILALFISVPMNGLKKLLRKISETSGKSWSDKWIHIFSFIFTIICVFFVFLFVMILLVPEIMQSWRSLSAQLKLNLPQWLVYLESMQWLQELLYGIDLEQTMQQISDGIYTLLPNVAETLSSTVNIVITAVFSIIVSIYITLSRERVCRHARKIVCAYLKPVWANTILRFCRMFYRSFTKFLSGQCGEAVILGTLMFLAFTVFQLPYASLVGVLTAVCAIIPYVGAFISCSVSILLTVLFDPTLIIKCAAVYLITQFIENQFIYPRVVGESVGLPPIYILIAAMIGGKLFGILGIIFFIPLMAVLVEWVKEDADRRLKDSSKEMIF